ncbi:hypothetical protein THAOC_18342 [Thalassiosira oceanica]|uniref:Uncharacterized protein n=1 Tax=Thalassiosira oceanica TaxID=159749 RepID=K0SJR1_THAOC|nr:hypothetical protein THAOC_18342 [Thalassiosira oceanica]|eukprot:EJK61211.1 hypothetical protein THAOC_18342 [Thalassiosira oceanica]
MYMIQTGKRREKNVRESLKYRKLWLPLLEIGGNNKSQGRCNHGVMEAEIPPIDHPVTHFINSLFKNEDTDVLSQGVLCSAVWNNAAFEALAKKLLLALGTQCLLKSSLKTKNSLEMSEQAENMAMAIYALELYERRSEDLTIEQRDDILVEAMIDNQKTVCAGPMGAFIAALSARGHITITTRMIAWGQSKTVTWNLVFTPGEMIPTGSREEM